jgi:hypothetical protein
MGRPWSLEPGIERSAAPSSDYDPKPKSEAKASPQNDPFYPTVPDRNGSERIGTDRNGSDRCQSV